MPPAANVTGLVLSGGGARAAYQVGALRAIAKLMPRDQRQPFPIICGTSAGAINAALLGSNADSFRRGVARLVRWWRRIVVTDVYRGDLVTLARHAVRLIGSLGGGGHGPRGAPTLLDNTPLAALLRAGIDLSRVKAHIESGHLRALGINATSYGTGHAVTFFEAAATVAEWRRARRRGRAQPPRHRAPDGIDRHSVRVSRGPRGRRLFHGRIGPADRAAFAGAPSWREANSRARGRPVHRAVRAGSESRHTSAHAILRSARSRGTRCRRYSSTISAPTSSACTRSIAS